MDFETIMQSSLEDLKKLLAGKKFVVSISGLDNMGKTTQANILGDKYPEIFSKPLHINQSPSFPKLKGKELSHWWFDPNNMEEFARTMYKALAERKAAAMESDSPIVVLDKGIDFYDERIKATLLTLGMQKEQIATLIAKIKGELGLYNSYEDLKVIIVPPKDSTRSFIKEDGGTKDDEVYQRYMKTNVELINKKIDETKTFTPVEFVEGDVNAIHFDILSKVASVLESKTQRTKVEQIAEEAREFFGDNLKMMVLAGSTGKGKFIEGWSDIDMYYFFDKFDAEKLSEYSEKLGKYGVHVGPTYYTTKQLSEAKIDARTVHVLLELEKGKNQILFNDGVEIPKISMNYAASLDRDNIPDVLNKLKRELLHKETNPNKDNTRDKVDGSSKVQNPYNTAKIIKLLSTLHKLTLKSLEKPIVTSGYSDTFETFAHVFTSKLKQEQEKFINNNDAENASKCQKLCDIINSVDIIEEIENRASYESCMNMHAYGLAVIETLDIVGYNNNKEMKICQNESAAELS